MIHFNLLCMFSRHPSLPTQSPHHTSGFSSGDIGTYMKPQSPQGKPYGTDDMAPYLDSSVTPSFYNTGYTPVPYDEIQDECDTSENSKKPKDSSILMKAGPSKGESSNSHFSPSGNTEDPKTLYSTVDKANKAREPVTWYQNGENGAPDIKIENPKRQKEKREKSGNFFDSEGSISGEDIDLTRKMKEVASNMSLRGSIKPASGGNCVTCDENMYSRR